MLGSGCCVLQVRWFCSSGFNAGWWVLASSTLGAGWVLCFCGLCGVDII